MFWVSLFSLNGPINKLAMPNAMFRAHRCIEEEELTKPYYFKKFYHIIASRVRLLYELDLN